MQLILVSTEDIFDVFKSIQIVVIGNGAGLIESILRVLTRQIAQSQTHAIGLLLMLLALQLRFDPDEHLITDDFRPVHQSSG